MNELITVKDGTALLSSEASAQIADFERAVKEIKEKEDALKEAIKKEMEEKGIIKLDTDDLAITYIAESDRERFDSKKFRSENPREYDKFVTISTVKPSIRIKLKGDK